MKILHINCNYLGTTLHQLMVRKLTALGVASKTFVPVFAGAKAVIKPDENVTVSECFKFADRYVFDLKQKKILRSLEKNIDVSEFQLIHAYTLFTDGNVARKLAKKYGKPYVVAVRNTDVNAFFKKMIHLRRRGVRIMLDAERVLFLSASYKQQVFEKYVPKKYREEISKKTVIIPNGIDDFWLENKSQKSAAPQDKQIRLVSACGIDKNKNISVTQKAVDILKTRGYSASFTVAGRVVDKKEYERLTADEDTVFLPNQPKEELISLYRKADIFVMPSRNESFGLVYAEAMTQGLPVVYTAGQGFDGQFPEGEVGFAVNCENPAEIADKIEKILTSYVGMSEKCTALADKFDWNVIVGLYYEIYRDII